MGQVIGFPRRHARTSGAECVTRASVSPSNNSADNPVDCPTDESSIAGHHSEGMRSRCHHLLTAEGRAPIADAIASREDHSSMTERNDDISDIANHLGHIVLKGKANMSFDCGSSLRHTVLMTKKLKKAENPAKKADPAIRAFGQIVRAARETHGHSQKELGGFAGIDQSRISKYERGEIAMGIDEALRIAILYQLDLGILLPGSKQERVAG